MKRGPSPFFVGVCVLVVTGVVVAFLAIGTPAHNRVLELDVARTTALEEMATTIRSRYRAGALPRMLPADFASEVYWNRRFDDPQTGRRYEYRRVDEQRFRLCATFSAPSDPDVDARAHVYPPGWSHPAGLFCKEYDAIPR